MTDFQTGVFTLDMDAECLHHALNMMNAAAHMKPAYSSAVQYAAVSIIMIKSACMTC